MTSLLKILTFEKIIKPYSINADVVSIIIFDFVYREEEDIKSSCRENPSGDSSFPRTTESKEMAIKVENKMADGNIRQQPDLSRLQHAEGG